MNRKLDKFLVKRFPTIFRDRNADMRTTCMCWGFDHGDGWARLIYNACLQVEFFEKHFGVKTVAVQMKEKYGTLCFYHSTEYSDKLTDKENRIVSDIIDNIISYAEHQSEYTCEVCGEHGQLYPGSWYVTRCEECALKEGRVLVDEKDLP